MLSANRSIDSDVDFVCSVLCRAVTNGTFGDLRLDSVTIYNAASRSSLTFNVDLELVNGEGKIFDVSGFVKSTLGGRSRSFHKEVIVYRDILPIFEKDVEGIFPKLYYHELHGIKDHEDVIILEDLKARGYVLYKEMFMEDVLAVSMIVQNLGKFHGACYKSKMGNPGLAEFYKRTLSSSRSQRLPLEKTFLKSLPHLMNFFDRDLLGRFAEKLKSYGSQPPEPEEPFATICHGAVRRDNVLFQFNQLDQPVDLKFLDLQNCLYSDPSVDLTLAAHSVATPQILRSHWNRLLRDYWTAVTSVAPQPGFTFDQFRDHLRRKSAFGLVECGDYLIELMRRESLDDDKIISGFPGLVEAIRHVLTRVVDNNFVDIF